MEEEKPVLTTWHRIRSGGILVNEEEKQLTPELEWHKVQDDPETVYWTKGREMLQNHVDRSGHGSQLEEAPAGPSRDNEHEQ